MGDPPSRRRSAESGAPEEGHTGARESNVEALANHAPGWDNQQDPVPPPASPHGSGGGPSGGTGHHFGSTSSSIAAPDALAQERSGEARVADTGTNLPVSMGPPVLSGPGPRTLADRLSGSASSRSTALGGPAVDLFSSVAGTSKSDSGRYSGQVNATPPRGDDSRGEHPVPQAPALDPAELPKNFGLLAPPSLPDQAVSGGAPPNAQTPIREDAAPRARPLDPADVPKNFDFSAPPSKLESNWSGAGLPDERIRRENSASQQARALDPADVPKNFDFSAPSSKLESNWSGAGLPDARIRSKNLMTNIGTAI